MCGGGIDLLPVGITFTGVMVKELMGHRFHINSDLNQIVEAQRRLKKIDPEVVFEPVEIFTGEREELRKRIKELNRMSGLPGVKFCPMAA